MRADSSRRPWLLASGTLVVLVALVVSGIDPYDRMTWVLEVAPAAIALPILWVTRERFPLTPLVYIGIFLHALVLIYGGAYTYARVPLGFELQEWFDLARNPYDRIGHFCQGFVPALITREILIRGAFVRRRWMREFLVLSVVLAISASYELLEWGVAVFAADGAIDFLGTQGDPWDTQSDMFLALIGALAALVTLSRWQDCQIRRVAAAGES